MKTKKQTQQNSANKKLLVVLTEKIREERNILIQGIKKEGYLFTVTKKFTSKYMSKYQYRQLLGLYDFMMANPNVTEDEIRKLIAKKPIEFAFLNKCVREIEDFLSELKKHGAQSMAEQIALKKGALEGWAKKHL